MNVVSFKNHLATSDAPRFGEVLRAMRLASGSSIEQAASKAHLTAVQFRLYEDCALPPAFSAKSIQRLAVAVDTDPDLLYLACGMIPPDVLPMFVAHSEALLGLLRRGKSRLASVLATSAAASEEIACPSCRGSGCPVCEDEGYLTFRQIRVLWRSLPAPARRALARKASSEIWKPKKPQRGRTRRKS